MKNLAFILFLFIYTYSISQTDGVSFEGYPYDNQTSSLGIGLYISNNAITLYNDTSLTDKYQSIDLVHNRKNIILYAKYHKPDYGIMNFVCIEQNDRYYTVIINYSTLKYISKISLGYFETWEDYILNSLGIGPKNLLDLKLYEVPNSSSMVIESSPLESYCPVQIKGDWLELKYLCNYKKSEIETCSSVLHCSKTAWVRWREKEKILIGINTIL